MFCYCSFSLFEICAYFHDTAGRVTNKIRADVTTAGQKAQKLFSRQMCQKSFGKRRVNM
jgi:hypothetical protein